MEDLRQAVAYAQSHGVSFLDYLLQEHLINRDLIGQAIAESFHLPYADLHSRVPSKKQAQLIPEDLARQYRVVVFTVKKKGVVVATDQPQHPQLRAALGKLFGRENITITYSLPEDIDASLLQYKKPLATRFSKIIAGKKSIVPELLEEIFTDALAYRASDIHFEPESNHVTIRFRIDGVLHEAGKIPKAYYENILNRIKIKSGLRIDEHTTAQDGALRYATTEAVTDMRTSIVPTIEGEKAVLRVLGAYVRGLMLGDLGLSVASQQLLKRSAKKPFGMILVVGPTGSGKTTTLYALTKLANSSEVNITTIEEPIEYRIHGVNQIQVNQQTNLTFASGLRSIIRQDPDIILVGEIRDKETAEISVNAALTGHLLYSTFHANNAVTAIPRLLDMGIEPFLLASTLEVIVAQRLVRKICTQCRYSVRQKKDSLTTRFPSASTYFPGPTLTLYQGKGCDACGYTGYQGRTAIFELIQITPKMQNLIMHSPPTQEIWELARREGSQSMFEDGVLKVKNGLTTLAELYRVAEPSPK